MSLDIILSVVTLLLFAGVIPGVYLYDRLFDRGTYRIDLDIDAQGYKSKSFCSGNLYYDGTIFWIVNEKSVTAYNLKTQTKQVHRGLL